MRYVMAALVAGAFALAGLLLGGPRLVFSLPAYALLAGACLLSFCVANDSNPAPNRLCLTATAALFGYVLLRQMLSPVEYLARIDLLLVLGSLMVYVTISGPLAASRFRWGIIAALLLLALGNIGLAAFQHLGGAWPPIFALEKPDHYSTRSTGLYVCPNHLAGFLEVTILLAASVALWSRRALWARLLAGYIAIVGLGVILLSGSRGGIAGMAIGLVVFAALSLVILRKTKPDKFWPAATIASVAALVAVAVLGSFAARQYSLQARSITVMDDANGRLALWQSALQQFKLRPAFGTGSGTFYYYGQKFRHPAVALNPEYAHNDYLQFLAEFGIFGFALLGVFLLVHCRTGWRAVLALANECANSSVAQSDRLAFAVASLSAIATYIVHSCVDFNLHIPMNAMLMALCFGIAANAGVRKADEPGDGSIPLRLAAPALALWMAFAGLKTWPAEYYGERARVALRSQQYPASAALATRAIQQDKTNPWLWLYLGQAQAEIATGSAGAEATNAWAAAVDAFASGIKLFPQERWLLLGMAEALDALNRSSEAENYFQNALQWDPNSAEVRTLYGLHLERNGRLAEAQESFQRSLDLRYTLAAASGLQRLAIEPKSATGGTGGR